MNDAVSKKIQKFFSHYKLQNLDKGEILINSYENPGHVYYLTEGLVKMYSISKNGNEIVLNIFKPGSFFPMSLVVNNVENEYYYECMTPVKLKTAPNEEILEFIKTNPDVIFDLLQRVYRGIDGILLKLAYAMSSDAKSRLIVELLTEAKRFGRENEKYVLYTSVSGLATTVGLARETVSREIKSLKNKKLISVKNKKITIYDLDRLEEELN